MVSRGSGHTTLALAAAHDVIHRGELISSKIVNPGILRSVCIIRNPEKSVPTASREVEKITITLMQGLLARALGNPRSVWKTTIEILFDSYSAAS